MADMSSTIETCSSGTSFTPLLASRYRLNLGPWLDVDPVKVDLISVDDGVVVVEELEKAVSLRSPDMGLRLLKVLLI